jgi:hypothetical protein
MTRFRFMIEGRDATGQFYVTCEVCAESLDDGRALSARRAREQGWEIHAYEEIEDLGPAAAPIGPGVKTETGRSYFDGNA